MSLEKERERKAAERMKDELTSFYLRCNVAHEEYIRNMGKYLTGTDGKNSSLMAILSMMMKGNFNILEKAHKEYMEKAGDGT